MDNGTKHPFRLLHCTNCSYRFNFGILVFKSIFLCVKYFYLLFSPLKHCKLSNLSYSLNKQTEKKKYKKLHFEFQVF